MLETALCNKACDHLGLRLSASANPSYSSTSITLSVPFALASSLATPSSSFLPDTSTPAFPF